MHGKEKRAAVAGWASALRAFWNEGGSCSLQPELTPRSYVSNTLHTYSRVLCELIPRNHPNGIGNGYTISVDNTLARQLNIFCNAQWVHDNTCRSSRNHTEKRRIFP